MLSGERGAIMQETIDRLRREKAEVEKRAADKKKLDYDKGWDDGLRWAREAHYEDLKRVAEYSPGSPGGAWAVDIETMYEDIIKDFAPGEEWGVGDVMAWARGWRNAARDFWGQVKDKLQAIKDYLQSLLPGHQLDYSWDPISTSHRFRIDAPTGEVKHRLALSGEFVSDNQARDIVTRLQSWNLHVCLERAGGAALSITSTGIEST